MTTSDDNQAKKDEETEETEAPEVHRQRRWDFEAESGLSDQKLKDLCNALAFGGKPKTDIIIERNPSNWPGMTKYVFHYNAPPEGNRR